MIPDETNIIKNFKIGFLIEFVFLNVIIKIKDFNYEASLILV